LGPSRSILSRPSAPALMPVLTEAAQVHALTVEEAQRGYPVRLRAVVTYYDRADQALFVHDESAGLFVRMRGQPPDLAAGLLVEVDGFSDPGEYAPIVAQAALRTIGRAALPTAQPKMYQELMAGGQEGQWIEVQGVVQAVWIQEAKLKSNSGWPGGRSTPRCRIPG